MPRQPTRNDYIVLFALGALWGSSFGAIKIALHGVTPLTVMSVRILLAGAALLLLILVRKTPLPRGIQNWIKIGWMALFGTLIPFFLSPGGNCKLTAVWLQFLWPSTLYSHLHWDIFLATMRVLLYANYWQCWLDFLVFCWYSVKMLFPQ